MDYVDEDVAPDVDVFRHRGLRLRTFSGQHCFSKTDDWITGQVFGAEKGCFPSGLDIPFPGQSICFLTTARACATNTSSHMVTCSTVATLATHRTAWLSIALPISIMAIMKPVFGKTNDHHVCECTFSLQTDYFEAFHLRDGNSSFSSH